MSETSQQLAIDRNNRYRDYYRVVMVWILILTVIAFGLLIILGYMLWQKPQPKYYATTSAGIVKPLYPLSQPLISNAYLLQWASLATRVAFNLQFVDFQQGLNQAKPYFTQNGWDKFLQALQTSGLKDQIIGEKLDMTAVVSSTPVILHQGNLHGRYTWRVQLPLLVTFGSASQTSQIRMLVTMDVSRVPTLDDAKGIQITNFEAQEQYV